MAFLYFSSMGASSGPPMDSVICYKSRNRADHFLKKKLKKNVCPKNLIDAVLPFCSFTLIDNCEANVNTFLLKPRHDALGLCMRIIPGGKWLILSKRHIFPDRRPESGGEEP